MTQIIARSWTRKQEKYMAWLATPDDIREPGFHSEMAKQLDVNESTLWRWKQKPGFMEAVADLAESYLIDDMPAVLSTLRARAKRGDFQHLKLYLEMAGRFVEYTESSNRLVVEVVNNADRTNSAAHIAPGATSRNGHRRPVPISGSSNGAALGQNGTGEDSSG